MRLMSVQKRIQGAAECFGLKKWWKIKGKRWENSVTDKLPYIMIRSSIITQWSSSTGSLTITYLWRSRISGPAHTQAVPQRDNFPDGLAVTGFYRLEDIGPIFLLSTINFIFYTAYCFRMYSLQQSMIPCISSLSNIGFPCSGSQRR